MSILKDFLERIIGGAKETVLDERGQVVPREKIFKLAKNTNTEHVTYSFGAPDGSDTWDIRIKDKLVDSLLKRMEVGEKLTQTEIQKLFEFAVDDSPWYFMQLLKLEYPNEIAECKKVESRDNAFGERKIRKFAEDKSAHELFATIKNNRASRIDPDKTTNAVVGAYSDTKDFVISRIYEKELMRRIQNGWLTSSGYGVDEEIFLELKQEIESQNGLELQKELKVLQDSLEAQFAGEYKGEEVTSISEKSIRELVQEIKSQDQLVAMHYRMSERPNRGPYSPYRQEFTGHKAMDVRDRMVGTLKAKVLVREVGPEVFIGLDRVELYKRLQNELVENQDWQQMAVEAQLAEEYKEEKITRE